MSEPEDMDQQMESSELGRKLRAVRKANHFTLQDVADMAHLSRSFISQVETGTVQPSIGSLKRISTALQVPIWVLLEDQLAPTEYPQGHDPVMREPLYKRDEVSVVRRDQRKVLRLPGTSTDIYLLTPDLQRKLEVSLSEIPPGHGYGDELYTHPGEEFGLVLEGAYEVTVGDKKIVLEEGDSIYFSSHIPHATRVVGGKPARTLWVNTPPSF